jgi:capsid protein
MIITDYEKYLRDAAEQELKWQKQIVPVRSSNNLPPQLSGDAQFRAYGGTYSPVYNDGSKFEAGLSPSGVGDVFDVPAILQNSRSAYSESLFAHAIARRYADTVVDTGIKLLPAPKANILGISAERAERWSDDVAQRFDCWFASKQCMLDEVDNGYQTQRFVEILTRRDGEYFVRFHYSSRRDLSNPLQLSIVDPTQLVGYGAVDTWGFNRTYPDGIVRDKGGKEVGYKVMVLTDEGYREQVIPARGPRSGRRFMLHGFSREHVDQGRGLSDFAHALQDFSNLTGFSQAQIMKAISQSQYNFKIVPSESAPASNPLESNAGIYEGEYSPAVEAVETSGEVPHVVYSRNPEVSARVPGATMVCGLSSGEDMEALENTAPSEQFGNFVEAFTTYLSASVSMPIEVLTMKFGRSYTASMGALILFWRVAEIGRMEQKNDWLDPVYEAWLSEEIAAGRVSAPGWSDPLMRQAWLTSRWGGAPMPIIDPAKQAKADKGYAEVGAQHLDDIARNYNGSDGRLNRAKLGRQYDELPQPPWAKSSGPVGGQ